MTRYEHGYMCVHTIVAWVHLMLGGTQLATMFHIITYSVLFYILVYC